MKESMWGYWIIVLGVAIMSVMVLLQNMTTTKEQDYFLLKGCLEAAMYDAVDYGYYRDTGNYKMNQEKFTENFIRRFSEIININRDYDITFYDIYEQPPAASVSVQTNTKSGSIGDSPVGEEGLDLTQRLTGILYSNALYRPTT